MKNIFNYTYKDLEDYFTSINEKKYKATQIYDYLYKKRIYDIDRMVNISKNTKEIIKKDLSFDFINLIIKQEDKNVKKFLFKLNDGNTIESVLMYHDYGTSLCVSSQVGCNMGCKFCESGRLKKVRNLETYEMIQQFLLIEKEINEKITHVVIMGIGEPFDNYDNVMNFIKILTSNKGIDLGTRHITVSTCGIIPGIEKFMKEEGQVNLAVSLHAPNDKLRSEIMPINKAYPLKDLLITLKKYQKEGNRRITFEYIMLENINDTEKCALELSKIAKELNCYINLIPYNETENIQYKRSKKMKILAFYDILKKNNINVTIRKEFGSKVDAACGQLRAKANNK